MDLPTRRHDWKSVVVWIDNPDLETPRIVGVFMSKSANTSLRFQYQVDLSSPYLNFADWDGEYQDLIMWEQLLLETCCAGHPSCRRGRGIRLKLLHHFNVKLR
ncbi:hypothetical protein JG687_00013296 [Phytophthora cactorum]|uniref:Necrosis inducing protein n=1 Tax=Phytophthora cactorum TaxID=29920 RepID=A0A8T1U1U5_9STRA|nr:Necrosis inducing protein [Phytophthora cactorum]KAG6951966.1 hypothetical protein JG687_00013296 [Phytophthora cactorum]